MWWLFTLLVLALIAFFVVKTMTSTAQQQQSEHDRLQRDTPEEGVTPPTGDTKVVAAAGDAAIAAGEMTTGEMTAGETTAAEITVAGNNAPDSGNTLADVREMIKILNLDGPDAGRLEIEREQLIALRKGDAAGVPDPATLDAVAARLRQMLA